MNSTGVARTEMVNKADVVQLKGDRIRGSPKPP